LPALDAKAIRDLNAASFHGACHLYEIGAPAMHTMMQCMLAAPGVIGARQAGAGFGGCMVALVKTERVDEFAAAVHQSYFAATRVTPGLYAVEAAAGAQRMDDPGPGPNFRPAAS
jgi:galactokinase